MNKMKKLLALTAASCLILTGCSGSKGADESQTTQTTAAVPTTVPGIADTAGETSPTSGPAAEGVYTPGTYIASAAGMNGDVTVEMTFDENGILSVSVTGDKETPGIGTLALKQLPDAVMEAQSADVNVIASATVTSNAILAAVRDCMDQAAGIAAGSAETAALEETADVVVVGAGGAGLAAAAAAGQNGASVIVLEAGGIVGGATIRSGGHMLVFSDEINASMDRNDEALQSYLTYDPADFGEWGDGPHRSLPQRPGKRHGGQ